MEIFSALLAICAGNSPVTGEFPTQRPVTRSFDVYFDLRPNERLSKQWWGWWFETLSRSLWRHRNGGWRADGFRFRSVSMGYLEFGVAVIWRIYGCISKDLCVMDRVLFWYAYIILVCIYNINEYMITKLLGWCDERKQRQVIKTRCYDLMNGLHWRLH